MIRLLGEAWALPWSIVGWALALVTGCDLVREGGHRFWIAPPGSRLWRWWTQRSGFAAVTIGTVTICAVWPAQALLEHEARHQQQARVLGPLYVPAYLVGCIVGALRGDWYDKNPMEEDARG